MVHETVAAAALAVGDVGRTLSTCCGLHAAYAHGTGNPVAARRVAVIRGLSMASQSQPVFQINRS